MFGFSHGKEGGEPAQLSLIGQIGSGGRQVDLVPFEQAGGGGVDRVGTAEGDPEGLPVGYQSGGEDVDVVVDDGGPAVGTWLAPRACGASLVGTPGIGVWANPAAERAQVAATAIQGWARSMLPPVSSIEFSSQANIHQMRVTKLALRAVMRACAVWCLAGAPLAAQTPTPPEVDAKRLEAGGVQYNSLDKTISSNFRIAYTYRPGSDIFLVFNEERGDGVDLWARGDRAALFNITWLRRF